MNNLQTKVTGKLSRYNYIDLLRGYFIFVIIVDHLQRWPSGFEFLTGKGALWVSAAEGFFIISGMMVGMIRGREWLKNGWRSATKKLWLRAAQLYALAVSMTLIYTYLAIKFGNGEGIKDGALANDSWSSVILQSLSGQYVYGWSDFLIYYAVFLFLSPLALWAIARGWSFLVIAVSIIVYLFGHGHFGMLWQPLFFGGLIFGFYLPRLRTFWNNLNDQNRKLLLRSTMGITIFTLILSTLFVHFNFVESWYKASLSSYFERFYGFGIGRLVLAPFWFLTIFYLFKRYEMQIMRFAGWLLMPFGQNALSAYTIHAIFVFLLNFVLPKSTNLVLNFTLVVLNLFTIWYIVIKLQPYLRVVHKRMQSWVV